jgi:hypothetical protein
MGERVGFFSRDTPFSQSILSFIFLIQLALSKVLLTYYTIITNPSQDILELYYFSMIKSTQQLNMSWPNIMLVDRNCLIYPITHYNINKNNVMIFCFSFQTQVLGSQHNPTYSIPYDHTNLGNLLKQSINSMVVDLALHPL